MSFYWKVALRNLLGNRRRSLKTILILIIGLSSCILAQGFMSYNLIGLRDVLIDSGLGHYQVYRQGYNQHGHVDAFKYLIQDNVALLQKDLAALPGIKRCETGLNFNGMAAVGERSAAFVGTTADLSDSTSVTLGNGLAQKLNATVGDQVTLMVALEGGGINALDVVVEAIKTEQIQAYDEVVLTAELTTIQELLDVSGAVDTVTLWFDDIESAEAAEKQLSSICDAYGLEYRNWRELAGVQYRQPEMFFKLVYVLFMSIILLVTLLAIANTMNLFMQERIGEIGTLRSLGAHRRQILLLFITESFILGVLGSILGVFGGYLIATAVNFSGGITIPPPPGHALGYIGYFRPDIGAVLGLALLFAFTSVIAAVYPSFRAARLKIVEALRSN